MNFVKSSAASLLASAFVLAGLAGCGSPQGGTASGPSTGAGGKTLHIAFAQLGEDSAWRSAETNSIKDEAKKRNIDLKFADAQGKQENQIKSVRTFIAQKVDAILIAPVVETGWEPVLKEAKDAGIPVIFVDHRAKLSDDSLYVTFIGADFIQEGNRAGKKIIELLGGKGNIAVLAGTPASTPALDREQGFEEALKASPNIKITFNETAEFNRSKGKEVMEACLKSHDKSINGVFAHNDDMAIGAIQAIKEAGLKPGTDIKIVSCDGIKECLQAIASGESSATVECNPLLGPVIFDTVNNVLAKKPVEKKIIVPDQEFDAKNAASSLPTRQY
jgi:simple sugar transport system substrate-binding protein